MGKELKFTRTTGINYLTSVIALLQWRLLRRTKTFTIQSVETWWRKTCLGRVVSLETGGILSRAIEG